MELNRAKLQQQQQQNPWIPATPAAPIAPNKRLIMPSPGLSIRPRDLKSMDMASSSRLNEAQIHNAGPHRTMLLNPTAGSSRVHYGNVMVITDAAGMQNIQTMPLMCTQVMSSNGQPLSLSNGKVLLSGYIHHGGNHPQDQNTVGYLPNLNSMPEDPASTSKTNPLPVPLIPLTPAKGKEIDSRIQHEMNKAVEKEIADEGSNEEDSKVECSMTDDHDSSNLLAPITPGKGKELECNPRDVTNTIYMGLTMDANILDVDQSSEHGSLIKGASSMEEVLGGVDQLSGHNLLQQGASSMEQVLEQPTRTSFSPHDNQLEEEKINQGRNPSNTRKKVTRKRHRPKVIKDGLLTSKKPVTPKPATPKQVRKKEQTGTRSNVCKKKNLNCSSTTPDMEIDANNVSTTLRKSANQHTENGTKNVKRRLTFDSESQSADEYPNSSRARLTTVQIHQGPDGGIGAGTVFDLNCSLPQYIRLQENPTPRRQPSRRELLKNNWKHLARQAGNAKSQDSDGVGISKLQSTKNQKFIIHREVTLVQDGVDYKEAKSYHSHADNAESGSTYPISSDEGFFQPQVMGIPKLPQECKRRRTMIGHVGEFGRMSQLDTKLSSSSDERKCISIDDLLGPEFRLALGPKGPTKKRSKMPIQVCKFGSNTVSTDSNKVLENPESSYQGCIEALFADTHIRMKRGKRTRKKRVNLKSISDRYSEHKLVDFLGQELIGLTSMSEDLQDKDLHNLLDIPIQECQRRSNILEPLCNDPMSQAIVPYIFPTDYYMNAAAEPQYSLVNYSSSMIVPYKGTYAESKKKRPRAKVDLDDETNRVWNLLMGKMIADAEGSDVDREERWEEERLVFRGRVDSFIARMRLIQGDRQFSPWKGSVLDSVIGVFLTQNVSDHLSSSAFMALAAKFPIKPKKDDIEQQDANKLSTMIEEYGSTQSFNMLCQENGLGQRKQDDGLDSFGGISVNVERKDPEVSPETSYYRTDITINVIANSESEDKGSLDDAVSSQNSVSLSCSTSNNLYQNTIFVESGPSTLLNRDMGNETMASGLDGYAACQDNIQISGANIVKEICDQDNNVKMLAEKCSALGQNSDNKTRTIDGLKNITYSFQEISCTSQLNSSQVNFTGMLQNFSSDSDNIENADVIKVERISSFMLSDPGNINADTAAQRNCNESSKYSTESPSQQSSPLMSNVTSPSTCQMVAEPSLKSFTFPIVDEAMTKIQKSERKQDYQVEKIQCHCQTQEVFFNSCDNVKGTFEVTHEVKLNSKIEVRSPLKFPTETSNDTPNSKKRRAESVHAKDFDWDNLRKEACNYGFKSARSKDRMDSLDWEAVMHSDAREISETIKERGMNNVLAGRIKDFLNRLVRDHGSLNLEWLRDVPPDKGKDYLLSIRGLGLKSVECVRLLTLHQHAFPVDTNVGRICVRLGWVPLQPLPESLQLHLLESYPILETIQKYLWPRLCTLDQPTLYELHYHMITFGKVFCTKSKPNCNACPMRGECRHFASAFASSRLTLTGPDERRIVKSTLPNESRDHDMNIFKPMPLFQIENCSSQGLKDNNEPIIEEPASPEPVCPGALESEIEEAFYEDPYEIPTIHLNLEEFTQNLQNYMQENMELQDGDIEKAIVAVTREAASIPMPKLKNVRRLRTEHQVYELPDGHPLLEGIEPREYDDPCPYLLSIWSPGETAHSAEPPQTCCNSQETGNMCKSMTCFACSCRREEQSQTIRGTLLIPCRTANRGSFPLNGTYFQVNEVFADHQSSHNPLVIPRRLIWNLPRRIVYFGTSIPTLFRGLSIEEIQLCFSRGFVCLRGFDRKTRAPKPLSPRLHLAASHAQKEKKAPEKDEKKATRRQPERLTRTFTS
ncbi:transcriptional activator DEMETER-like [Canna indica]|uniref:Transcriptional activator DEMETER-like n=1 Tax=Canna indica TaxID=4628 RepID=A0AAQ3K7D1_9LILI|nr:transcriptional activator DEMETER-like [Canna indica]